MKKIIVIVCSLVLSVSCFALVPLRGVGASTFDTTSYLQDFEASARQDPDFSVSYPFSVTDPYHTLYRGMPDKYIGVPVTGSNKGSTTSTFDFSSSVANYSYNVGGSNKFYYFKKLTISNPFETAKIPYLWFMPDHGSNMDTSGSGADWLLILDSLSDGSKVFRFIAIYTDLASKTSVWYQSSWPVGSDFVPFVDGSSSDTSWFQTTGKNALTASNYVTFANANGLSYDFFDCYNSSTGLYALVSLYPDSRVVSRQINGIFRGDLRYRFYDYVYADSSSAYYNSLFSDLSVDFARLYSENVAYVKSIISPYRDQINVSSAEYTALKNELDFYKLKYDVLSGEFQSLKQELVSVGNDLDYYKGKYNELTASYNSLSASYDELQRSNTALQSSFDSLTSTHNTLVSNYSSLQDSYNALNSSKLALDKSYSELQAKFDSSSQLAFSDGYSSGYDIGFSDGRSQAISDGMTIEYSFSSLLWSIVDAPVRLFTEVLDFDLFGINLASLVKFIVSALLVTFVVRRFI